MTERKLNPIDDHRCELQEFRGGVTLSNTIPIPVSTDTLVAEMQALLASPEQNFREVGDMRIHRMRDHLRFTWVGSSLVIDLPYGDVFAMIIAA